MSQFTNARVGDRVWSVLKGWGTIEEVNKVQGPGFINVRFDAGEDKKFSLDGKQAGPEWPELYWDEIHFDPPPPPERWVEKTKWLAPVIHPRSGLIFVTSCGVPEKYDSSHEAIRAQTEYASRADTYFAQYPKPIKLTWHEKEG